MFGDLWERQLERVGLVGWSGDGGSERHLHALHVPLMRARPRESLGSFLHQARILLFPKGVFSLSWLSRLLHLPKPLSSTLPESLLGHVLPGNGLMRQCASAVGISGQQTHAALRITMVPLRCQFATI